ncbi:hypothetical protein L4D12_04510 [Photobacterium nomapromontoriensis]
MDITEKQLKQAYRALLEGAVCIDDNLALGVLVYVDSLMVIQGITRKDYLTYEQLQTPDSLIRMGSLMPIDFFGSNDNPNNCKPCRDSNFKPITLKVCDLIELPDQYPERNWRTVAQFESDDIASAIHTLLNMLCDSVVAAQQ